MVCAKVVAMAPSSVPGAGSPPGRSEQDRAVRRRAAILAAAGRLLVRSGMSAISHRAVAAEADVPLGAIRYYFDSRESLVLACMDHFEAVRREAAATAIERARAAPPDTAGLARLALVAYYGPDLDDATLRGAVGSMADFARESPALSHRLAEYRVDLDRQLDDLLVAAGRSTVSNRLMAAVIDGSILSAVIEARTDIAELALADLTEFLELSPPDRSRDG